MNPKILFANARSAVNKLDVISTVALQQSIKCIAIAETWFNDGHSEDITHFSNFVCFRNDRSNGTGGGVAVWAHCSLHPHVLSLEGKPSYIEAISVCIFSYIYILCVYVPPIPSVRAVCREDILRFLTESIDSMTHANPKAEIVICGDFNRFPVHDLCNVCNLTCMFFGNTYNSNQLDYFLMSESLSECYSVTAEAPVDNSKVPHVSLLATPRKLDEENFNQTGGSSKYLFDTRKSYVKDFVNLLQNVDWSPVYRKDDSLDLRVENFHKILHSSFSSTIPSNEVLMTPQDKPWMTPLIKHLINQRWEAYRSRNFAKYHHFKEKVKREIAKTKTAWIKSNKNKNIWKVVKMISGKATRDPVTNLCSQFSNLHEAADAINAKFCSHFQRSDVFQFLNPLMSDCPQVSCFYVYNHLCKLNPKKSSPDLPCKLYKAAAHVIAEPLTALFNESLKSGFVPLIWKRAIVIPVPKCASPTINDLRPISLLPIPVKILERFVLDAFKPMILDKYGKNQFGFRPQSSTTAALVAVEDFVTSSLDKNDVIGVQIVAYDLSKAFDKLKHDVILSQLSKSDLPSSIVSWFQSYFTDRSQCVQIERVFSSFVNVTSGVPQGSIVGPYLFSMVAGSFPVDYELSTVIKYADDFTLCSVLLKDSPNAHISLLHDSFVNWSLTHGLKVNVSKCKSLCITRSKNCLPVILPNVVSVKKLKILGVTFNDKLQWSLHCDSVVKNASRRLYVLRVLRNVISRDELISVYYAIVRSYLEYASPLFVGLTKENSTKLERIQKRFHRLLCGPDCRKTCLEPLDTRRFAAAVKFFLKTNNPLHVLNHLSPKKSSTGRYVLPATSTTRRLNSFFTSMILYFNSVYVR